MFINHDQFDDHANKQIQYFFLSTKQNFVYQRMVHRQSAKLYDKIMATKKSLTIHILVASV